MFLSQNVFMFSSVVTPYLLTLCIAYVYCTGVMRWLDMVLEEVNMCIPAALNVLVHVDMVLE